MTNPYAPGPDDVEDEPPEFLTLERLHTRVVEGEEATATVIETLGRELVELKELVARLLEQERAKTPHRWVTYATVDDWDALADWVDALNTDYSLNRQYAIRPCWPQHPGVVEDLAALHSSWRHAAISAESTRRGGSNDYIAWHDRWLWPTLRRIRENHYDIVNCTHTHTGPRSEVEYTIRPWT